ncbi:glycinol 4-dimethylallyltransferase isoform X2 [Cajanus cajan]|uniref:glycinol 4-dimethylallyltransferase isoform X2 n=1 Tax=Cajanus cajan TaxID=3821 RepID=UPI00098DC8CF|nr:glycinol 4-dimethylallyltransferase isoform X2 [Cajanus cajan]
MDGGLVISSNVCSVTTGGNLGLSRHSTKNLHCASSWASKSPQYKRKTQIECNLLSFQQQSLKQRYKCIEGKCAYEERNKKYFVKAISNPSFDSEHNVSHPKNLDTIKNLLAILYKFCYPYAMIGLALNIISSSLFTVENLSNISPLFFIGVLQVVIPHMFITIYINGVNQLFDVEIDKMNKSYLPLASGQLSFKNGVIVAASFLTLSFCLSWIIGSWSLIWGLVVGSSIWTAYSINVPFLRWKRHPLLAMMCTVASQAFILPIVTFLHMQTFLFKRSIVFPRSLIFGIVFLSLYAVGMALVKDISDVEGDKTHGIDTFSIRLGQKQVLWISVSFFEMAFGVGLLAGTTSSYLWSKIIMGLGHAALGSIIWYKAKCIDLESKASIKSFYVLTWQLMNVAYFLVALIR